MKNSFARLGAVSLALLFSFVLLAGIGPAASAAGPLFRSASYPDFRLSSTEAPEVTVEALCDANSYDTLIAKYGGFGVETFANPMYTDGDEYSLFYGTADYNFYQYAQDPDAETQPAILMTLTDLYRIVPTEDGGAEFGIEWTAEPGWEDTVYDLRSEAMALDEEALLGSAITFMEDNGDGTLSVVLLEGAASDTEPSEDSYPEEDWTYDAEPVYDDPYVYNDWTDGYDTYGAYDDGVDGSDDAWTYDPYSFYEGPDAPYAGSGFGNGVPAYGSWSSGGWDAGYRGFRGGHDWNIPGYAFGEPENSYDPYAGCEAGGDTNGFGYADADLADADVAADAEPVTGTELGDTWYDNAVSWYDEHPYSTLAEDLGEEEVYLTLTVDRLTLEILKVEETAILDDGSEELLMVQIMSYCAPETALLEELLNRGALHYAGEDLVDPRTVTVIYNPGTDDEIVCSRTVEKGDLLYASFLGGYQICADETGTPFSGGSSWEDVTLYAFPLDYTFDDAAVGDAGADVLPADAAPLPELTEPEVPDLFGAPVASDGNDVLPEPDGTGDGGMMFLPGEESGFLTDSAPVIVEEMPYVGGDYVPQEDEVPAEPAEESADSAELDFDAVNHAVFEANSLERILENHDSVEYRLIFDLETVPEWPDYIYETSDMAYAESPKTAIYVGDGNYYELVETDYGTDLYYVFDFFNDYDPIANAGYEIVPEGFDEWWNSEDETPLACYVENNEVHLLSMSTSDRSREFMENYLQLPYNGEHIITEVIADANTYEIIRFVYLLESDGMVYEPLIYEVDYDEPEPRACRNLRAAAERDTADTVEVTLVMNPGREDEVIQSKTVPVGSNVVYIAEQWMDMYEDPECTVPAGQWDKTTDHTYYMLPSAAY